MSVLGKLTNSILSGTNENNISLANLNIDFSLLKFEAPESFQPLASALSTHRRYDAEEGRPHKTARRLGALFEDLIPTTPRLIEAFGKRISEVVENPEISRLGTDSDGPFERFVGADGTTLWAAATSGISAIAVYLLSCLLARKWDAKQATALWVELIEQRKKEVEHAYGNNHIVSASALFSLRQDISREDLARWDNSARSWLRSADRAKTFERDQLMLIERNISLRFTNTPSTYTSVITAWREAMLGLEALLSGKPLQISSGSLFAAFSSWHLFPDLIVLGNKTTRVKFDDQLFPAGGVGTVGRESVVEDQSGGIQWSLTISHLRYYGDPELAQADTDCSRVTFQELRLVVLGSLLHAWRISTCDIISAAQWFMDLWSTLEGAPSMGSTLRSDFGWLANLVLAAREVVMSKGSAQVKCDQLVRYGMRRAKTFLHQGPHVLSPFFGLCNTLQLDGLSAESDMECGIAYLRALAQDLALKDQDAIICYAPRGYTTSDPRQIPVFQISTAVAHARQT